VRLSIIPPLERYPRVVSFAQRPQGKLALLFLFCLLLSVVYPGRWVKIAPYLFFFSFWPEYRRVVLAVATLSWAALGYTDFYWVHLTELLQSAGAPPALYEGREYYFSAVSVVLLFCGLWVHLAGRSRFARWLNRPVLLFLLFYMLLLCLASYVPLPPLYKALLWVFAVILGRYLWFLCYSLVECRRKDSPPFFGQVGHYLPFWSPGNIPFPKGASYLAKIEARTPAEMAVSQLKGLKLLLWAMILSFLYTTAKVVLYGESRLLIGPVRLAWEELSIVVGTEQEAFFHLPSLLAGLRITPYREAFDLAASGAPLAWHLNWSALVADYLFDMLFIAVTSHIVIAVCRMCGFNALRNVHRPLRSRTLLEYWGRLYYYFKEMLVAIFFYPTFFRYFKDRPTLRLYAATMAAACVGNFLFHFFRDIQYVFSRGFFGALADFHVGFFYAFILGNAIFISQWRSIRNRGKTPHPLSAVYSPILVLGFYCLLHIFVDHRREPITQNFSFMLSLFGIGR
jgi:hypothetical protein